MKARKIKIKINAPGDTPADAFERSAIEDFKRLQRGLKISESEYDMELTFPNIFWLNKVLSPERIKIYKMIKLKKPQSIYQLAKFLNRAVANVQRDVQELAAMGVLELKKNHKKGQKRESVRPEWNYDGFDIAV